MSATESTPQKRLGEGATLEQVAMNRNPSARAIARRQRQLADFVSEEDLQEIVEALVAKAKAGDVMAAREIFNRLLGKPLNSRDPDRLEVDAISIEADRLEAERKCRTNIPGYIEKGLAGF